MSFWKRLFGQKETESILKLNLQTPHIRTADMGKSESVPVLASKQQKTPPKQEEAPLISATGSGKDNSVPALTPEQQKAMWLDSITLELLSSAPAAVFTVGTSGVSEQQVSPEVAAWAKPLVDLIQKADALARNDRYEEAIRIYRQVLEKAPDAAIVLMSIGSCWASLGVKETALIWFRRALKAAPSNERIHRNLSIVERM